MCSIEGCEKQSVARGWCANHYALWKRHGDPLVKKSRWDGHERKLNRCIVPGCDWEGYKKKVCPKHARRMQKYGSYDEVRPKGRQRGDDQQRFWSKVLKTDTCWLWQGGVQAKWGYGLFRVGGRAADGKTWLAHRYAWTLVNGPIPAEKLICHHCDVPACVRPDHLFMGTDADNNADKEQKGRGGHPTGDRHGTRTKPESVRRGEENNNSVLTEEIVREIRRLYAARWMSQSQMAVHYGVSQGTINGVIHRKTWKHVE